MYETIYSVYLGALSMIKDRGYSIENKRLVEKDFKRTYSKNFILIDFDGIFLSIETTGYSNKDKIIKCVKNTISSINKLNKKNVKVVFIMNYKNEDTTNRYITSVLNETAGIITSYNLLKYSECEYVPTNHIMVPHHEIISEDEKAKIPNIVQLQKINITDRMVRWLGCNLGDVLKIKRYNKNSIYSIAFRLVVEGEENELVDNLYV